MEDKMHLRGRKQRAN